MQAAIERIREIVWPAVAQGEEVVIAAQVRPVREIVRRFWPDARPFRGWLALLLLFAAVGPALETVTIWLYKLLVDEVLVPGDIGPFPSIALAYLALTIVGGLVSFGDSYLSDWTSERFLLALRTRVYARLQRMAPDFFAGQRRGDLIARLTDDVDDVEALVISGIVDLINYIARIVFFTGALFFLSWRLALLALIVAPLFLLASRAFSSRIKEAAREERRRGGSVSAIAEEGLANVPLIQAYNLEDVEVDRFRREAHGGFVAQMALTRTRAFFSPLLDLFELGGVLVVIGAGVWELAQGNITLGGLLIFLTYLTQLLSPVRGLSQLVTSVAASSAGAERVIELLDQAPDLPVERLDETPAQLSGELRFERVSFRYPSSQRDALHDVSFQLKPGETLAIVGASGAGKSTIGRLLLRFYEPTSGRILIGDRDLREVEPSVSRASMAAVLQESLVFAGSIRENIARGRPGATQDEIVRAAKAADAHDFILALSNGYETRIGQGGTTLSGGQKQRLAIARAIVRDAPILLLDEPTTGLDIETSDRILTPLRRLMADRASIVISHDLLTTREATEIIVLDRGDIVERGTHDELIERGGYYARLYRRHQPEKVRTLERTPNLVGVA